METPIQAKIASAFVKAQKAFGPALKSSTQPHVRSRYADLSACVEAVIDALNANGIALMQKTYECKEGVMVETIFVHESGEVMESGLLHVPAVKHDAQGYGSALTYARRYSLMAACGIAPEDDDGNSASRRPEAKPTTKVDPKQMADHLAAIEACIDMATLKTTYNAAYAACDGDAMWQAKVMAAKDKQKKALTNG
jgi:hypothetical protein